MSTTSSESLACPVIQPGKLSRRGATAFHAFVLMSFLAASAAPTPLYRVYQQEWDSAPRCSLSSSALTRWPC